MTGSEPQTSLLPDGRRLHLHHGPIDLIVEVFGANQSAYYTRASDRFQTILTGLVAELAQLRRPLSSHFAFTDPVARRMARAASAHAGVFVTPMAAVAGAVADEVLAAMISEQSPVKAYVNNGGDIAFHLSGDQILTARSPAGDMTIAAGDKTRGVATSGWQGRSHSFGIRMRGLMQTVRKFERVNHRFECLLYITFLNLDCGLHTGGHDPLVPRAATNVARDRLADIALIGCRILVDIGGPRHDHAGARGLGRKDRTHAPRYQGRRDRVQP